ncbi:MAG: 1-acyl-sn-glycerol-3-phosphate acyltransferase [Candidatus Marinimicrobia bacterium]|nr:1-acyl-sn-glycerol-3-phosphate acyltransferase [Candidatus Neomarinimicrobiota bacterium]
MKSIISIIMWLWGLTLLLLMLIIINLLMFIPGKSYDPISKWMARNVLKLMRIKINVKYSGEFDSKGTYLYMSNHANMLDPLLLYGHLPNFVRAIELADHFRWPIYGWTLRRMGHIPIDNQNASSAMKSLRRAAELLQKGISIVILPEGQRTRDGKLSSFKRGSFILAKEGGRDIIPVAISGGWEITHRGSWLVSPGKMTLRIGEPIREHSFRDLSTGELRDLCKKRVEELLDENNETVRD